MRCRSCGRALEADARFCPGCGSAVAAACAACGADLDPDARFCKHCGQAIEAPGPSDAGASDHPARERKIATLLFADIVGFTELGERLDAEVVSSLVAGAFERLSVEVERYGGTVEKFAGDALLAVFGVPATHEDDPERAVRAALEMQSVMAAAGREGRSMLHLRIGVESGEILADTARVSSERDLFVTGDPVNTAARLQESADPGTVVVGPGTYASTRGLIEYEELQPIIAKGKHLPVAVWRAVRIRARRGGVRAPLGLEAPLIGRDEELALLKETIRRTVSSARPHLVTVAGEAGVGKTRLIWELEKYLDGLPDTFHWRKGRCYSYASASFSPLVEAVKADARIAEDDPPGAMSEKLDARIDELAGEVELPVRPALRTLLGLPVGSPLPQDELFEAWRAYLAAIARRHPLVLVAEDTHWADEVTLDFLEFVARWGDAPIVLICLTRPELLERRETWGGGARNATQVELAPLEASETASLIDELLDGALPAELRERVVAMANGNPLFTEELVRMFIDQGVLQARDGGWRLVGPVTELTVPGSVQAVLSARLDALDTAEKRVAQEASVVGRIFWDVIVAHLRDRPAEEVAEALHGMRVKELVSPRVPSSMAGASEWSFRHVLVRDVAYESLPKRERAELHQQVARWAEIELAARRDEFAELVASHLAAALGYREELRDADGDGPDLAELRSSALEAAARAARRAAMVQDVAATRRWLVFAVEQARALDRPALERASLADTYDDLVWHESGSQERQRVFGEAVALLEPAASLRGEDLELWGRLMAALAQARFDGGDGDGAIETLRQAAGLLRPTSPSQALSKVLQTTAWARWHRYEFEAAGAAAKEALSEAQASGAEDVYRWALHEAGVIAGFQGDPERSIELLRESLELARAAGDHRLTMRCMINIPSVMTNSGYSFDESLRLLEEGASRARRSSAYGSLAYLLDNLSANYFFCGRFEEAYEVAIEALDAARRAGFGFMETTIKRCASDALAAMGQHEESRILLEQAIASASDDPQHHQWLLISQSRAELLQDPQAAVARLSGEQPKLSGYPNAELQLAPWLARVAYRVGDQAAIAEAVEIQRRHRGVGGPLRELERRWVAALAQDDDEALTALVAGFEGAGIVLYRVEVLIDAALVAARAGRPEPALSRAREAVDALGYHPLLGPLPETRWLAPASVGT
jgi:class 3 adenylate cyclase/tetratricopeptide (TPR) repeat protein